MDAFELEGMEPIVINDLLVGYEVQSGQGPSQIALDINNEVTQKQYGYKVKKPVTWSQIVSWNFDTFRAKGNWDKPNGIFDINNETFKNLNINKEDVLWINSYPDMSTTVFGAPTADKSFVKQGRWERPVNPSFSSTISGADVEANAGFGIGGSMSGYNFDVPEESIFWEGGSNVIITTVGGQISTPGLSVGVGIGSINFDATDNPSLTDILNSPSHSETGGGITPIGFGAKHTTTNGVGFNSSLTSVLYGTPGPVLSYTNSSMGKSEVSVSGLKTTQDSINRARIILKNHPTAEHARSFLMRKEGAPRRLRKDEL